MVVNSVDFLGWSFIQGPDVHTVAAHICKTSTVGEMKYPIVFTPNAYILSECYKQPDLAKQLAQSAFILPDGQPLVWLSKNIRKRITGADIFQCIWNDGLVAEDTSLIISPTEKASAAFAQKHPNVHLVSAPQMKTAQDITSFAETLAVTILKKQVEHVFIHLGFSKQEQLALQLLRFLKKNYKPVPKMYCFGAALEFYTHTKTRAPQWMRNNGLEWLFRLTSDPIRLARRYLIESPKLMWYIVQGKNLPK